MNKFTAIIINKIKELENYPSSVFNCIATLFCLISLRIFVELILTKQYSISKLGQGDFIYFVFLLFSHSFFYFLIVFLVLAVIIKKLLKTSFKESSNLMLFFGFFMLLFPPIIDYLISSISGKYLWSFYEFYGIKDLLLDFIYFFGKDPYVGITPGPRIFAFVSLVLFFIYSLIKTKKIIISILSSFLAYVLLFLMGSIPSWITIITNCFSKNIFIINQIDIAQEFISPLKLFSSDYTALLNSSLIRLNLVYSLSFSILLILLFFVFFRKKTISFISNIRIPQLAIHEGLLIIGAFLGYLNLNSDLEINFFNFVAFLAIAESVALSWISSIIFNDIFDYNIDTISNKNRPLIIRAIDKKLYLIIGISCFILAIWMSAFVNVKISLLLLTYQILAWIYSAGPLRLKRFPFISTFISAVALILILFSGIFVVAEPGTLNLLHPKLLFLLIFAFTFSLPLKDFKDIAGDKKDNIYTIPVVLGEYWGKIIVGSGIFISFLLSVIFLNEFRLLWWALFFGGTSFWLINKMQPSERIADFSKIIKNPKCLFFTGITYRNIFWWILIIIAIYSLILAKIIFL